MNKKHVIQTQSSVIRIICCNVGPKWFFHLPTCLLLSLVFTYIYISQGSVEMHLCCGWIYNIHIIANCPQCASENFKNRSIIGKYMDKSEVPRSL